MIPVRMPAHALRGKIPRSRQSSKTRNNLAWAKKVLDGSPVLDEPLLIPLTPRSAPRMNRADAWKSRPVILAYRAYRDLLRQHIGQRQLPDSFRVIFVLPMPKSWSATKKAAMLGQPHQSKPDSDNLEKALLDIQGGDERHWHVTKEKYWGYTGSIYIEPSLPPALSSSLSRVLFSSPDAPD